MELAHIRSPIACVAKGVRDRSSARGQQIAVHAEAVYVAILTGEKPGAEGHADWALAHGQVAGDALRGKTIKDGRARIRVAVAGQGLVPKLIGEEPEHIGST